MSVDRARAEALVRSFAGRKIAVIGDLMLDHFIWGTVSRISPEAPVPVVRVSRESYHLGGAGNVACNLKSLGAEVALAGVVGKDDAGRRVMEAFEERGLPRGGVVEIEGRMTTKKTRIIAHSQQVVRFDREEESPLDAAAERRLNDAALASIRDAAALVVSDYEKGTVSPALLGAVLPRARQLGRPVVVDPKPAHYEAYRPVTAITPNVGEASQMSGIRIRADADAERAAGAILSSLGCEAVLLTQGERGMLLCEAAAEPFRIATAAREVFDVTGAGDTVVATFVLALASGASKREAAVIANAAAGIVVGKVGTATVTPEELVGQFAS